MTAAGDTEDTLLCGRVHLRQPPTGLRAGLDAVMLAASVPAQPGQVVLELGCGTGAAFLCLLARVPELRVMAIERDPELADYARDNAIRNGCGSRVEILSGDVVTASALGPFDHSFTNPPWWSGNSDSPSRRRAAATHAAGGPSIDVWIAAAAKFLRRSGTATAILPTPLLDAGLGAMRVSELGGLRVIPLWPRRGREAKRIIVSGAKASRSPTRLLSGLILHDEAGWSGPASAVLRGGRALAEVLEAPAP